MNHIFGFNWNAVYAKLTVPRILNGKEVSRATRAHLIIYGTLMGLMLLKQLEIEKFEDIGSYPDFLKDFLEMVNLSLFDKVNVTDIKNSENFQKLLNNYLLLEMHNANLKLRFYGCNT